MSHRFVLLALSSLFVTFAPALRAQAPAANTTAAAAAAFAAMPDDAIVGTAIRLPDADIDTVLGALELYTGKNIFRPATLPVPPTGGFNVMVSRPGGVTKADAIQAIETVLELNNIYVVPLDDKFLKVVPQLIARTESPPMISGSTLGLPSSGRISTKIFQLNFLTAQVFAGSINNLMTTAIGGTANIAILATANAVMVTDTITNLQRIEKLADTLDKPNTSNLSIKSILLKNARATTTLTQINQALAPAQLAQLGGRVSADDRANQILVVGDSQVFAFYQDLISRYDVKADPNTKQEVILLKCADAATLAPILSQIVGAQTTAAQRTNAGTVRPGQGAVNQGPAAAGGLPGTVPVGPAAPVIVNPNAGGPVVAAPAGGGGGNAGGGGGANTPNNSSEFSSLMTILPDARTNSIVVNGTVDDIRLIRELIDKLDVLLPQVSIEVVIAEVTLNNEDVSGISALGLTVGTDTPTGTRTLDPATGAAVTLGTTDGNRGTHITNFSGTAAGFALTGGVVNPLAFNALMTNNGSRSNVKILQANTITTTHNKQATVQVTQREPYSSSTTAATATSGSQSQTSFLDVGITMQVTPLIGPDGSIQMTIDQAVDDVSRFVSMPDGGQVPATEHRQATSFVNIRDGEMIVLGGLQTTKLSNTRQKMGFIWEIPILSNLLGNRDKVTTRTELLFFIRPHVIKPGQETANTNERINQLSNKDQVQQYLKDPSKPAKESVLEFVK